MSTTVPTPISRIEIYLDAIYEAVKSSGSSGSDYNFKGAVDTVSDLPASNNQVGDLYIVKADGKQYVWSGSEWVQVDSETIEIATDEEVAAIISDYEEGT